MPPGSHALQLDLSLGMYHIFKICLRVDLSFFALKINHETNAHLEDHFCFIIHCKQCWRWPEKPSAVATCSVVFKHINFVDRLFVISISWLVDFFGA